MAKVAEYDGMLWEVAGFAEDFVTGKDMVILKRWFSNANDFLNLGCSYAGTAKWVISTEEFKEKFRWINYV